MWTTMLLAGDEGHLPYDLAELRRLLFFKWGTLTLLALFLSPYSCSAPQKSLTNTRLYTQLVVLIRSACIAPATMLSSLAF